MANVFLSLPVPAGDGVGAWVDVSSQGPERTISVDGGSFAGTIYLEASNDGQASAAPAGVGPFTGPTQVPQTFMQGLNFMRVRRAGSGGVGTPTVNLAAPAAVANAFGAMNVPAGDGVGTAIDLSGGGDVNTFQVEGPYSGQILIETSTDGVSFSPTLLFTTFHGVGQTIQGVLSAARVRRRGSTSTALPLVSVGSQATSGAAGGAFPGYGGAPPQIATAGAGGASALVSRADHTHAGVGSAIAGAGIGVSSATGAVTITNTGVTSNVAGTGISVSGATGAVTITNTGVTSAVAGAGVSVSGATGAVTIANTGVLSIVAGTGIGISGGTGNVTISVTGGAFPGFGGAPPGVANASAAGAAGTASRSDHTHAGVLSIVAGTNVTIANDGAGNITVNASGGGAFPGFGGAPPSVASASAAGAAGTASRSDHTHALDLVTYTPSVAGMQAAGVMQQTFPNPTAVPAAFAVATSRIPFGNAGLLATSANFTFVTATNTLTLAGTSTTVTLNPNAPFMGWGATTAAANTSTVMRFAMTPPNVVSGAGHSLDAYNYDPVTVNLTGNTGTGVLSLVHVQSPTYNHTGTAIVAVATAVEINPPIKAGGGSWTLSAALYLNDPNSTGNANLIVNDVLYTSVIAGATGLGAQPLAIVAIGTNPVNFITGASLDASGGNIEGTLTAGVWSLGRVAAVQIDTTGDVVVGTATPANNATTGFPYIPTVPTRPTGTLTSPFGAVAALCYGKADGHLEVYDPTGNAWLAIIPFASTAAPGAQVSTLTNLPTSVVSTTPKWEAFKDPNGVASVRPYWQ